MERLGSSRFRAREILSTVAITESHGVTFPADSDVFSYAGSKFVVRNTEDNVLLVERWLEELSP